MPELIALRKQGDSFEELSAFLNQHGLELDPATVRAYYCETLAWKLKLYEKRMDAVLEGVAPDGGVEAAM